MIGRSAALLTFIVLAPSALAQQQPAPPIPAYNAIDAKKHVGELAIVCGLVVESQCKETTFDVILKLAPIEKSKDFMIRIPSDTKDLFGSGLPTRWNGNVACAGGTIERIEGGFEVLVKDPRSLDTPPQLNPTPIPVFAPNAHQLCDRESKPPTPQKAGKPEYTRDALARRVEGKVVVLAVVEVDGTVGDVRVDRSVDPDLDKEAIKAAKRWRFSPGTFQGTPVPMVVKIELDFMIRK
jgi:TonB family protein